MWSAEAPVVVIAPQIMIFAENLDFSIGLTFFLSLPQMQSVPISNCCEIDKALVSKYVFTPVFESPVAPHPGELKTTFRFFLLIFGITCRLNDPAPTFSLRNLFTVFLNPYDLYLVIYLPVFLCSSLFYGQI